MTFALRAALVVAIAIGAQASANAAVISFDDLDTSAGDLDLRNQVTYQGLAWANFFAYTSTPGFDGFNNGIVSQDNASYSGGESFGSTGVEPTVGSLRIQGDLDLLSAYVGAGYYDGLKVIATGLRAGAQLFSKEFIVNTSAPQLVSFQFLGVDEVLFMAQPGSATDPFACGTFNCTQFTIDDLEVTLRPASTSIPEPSGLLLVAAATAALIRQRHHRTTLP